MLGRTHTHNQCSLDFNLVEELLISNGILSDGFVEEVLAGGELGGK